MAELKWEIWESVPAVNRKAMPSNYYDKFLEEKLGGWMLTLDEFMSGVCKDAKKIPPDEVFEPIRKLHKF